MDLSLKAFELGSGLAQEVHILNLIDTGRPGTMLLQPGVTSQKTTSQRWPVSIVKTHVGFRCVTPRLVKREWRAEMDGKGVVAVLRSEYVLALALCMLSETACGHISSQHTIYVET